MRDTPRKQEWKALIDAVIEFRKVSCWDWMYDSDIFAVQNPENGEIGYCSVLGCDSTVTGLIVFLGDAGFSTLMQMYTLDQIDRDSLDFLFLSKYVLVTFEDHDELDDRDLEIYESLRYRFEGEKSWPRFRRRDPGYCPWYFSDEDARFLKLAVEQALSISTRLIRDEITLFHPKEAEYILLRKAIRSGKRIRWEDSWYVPSPPLEPRALRASVDGKKVRAIRTTADIRGSWEVDTFFAPLPTAGKDGRPFYPLLLMCVERESGLLIGTKAVHPGRCEIDVPGYLLDLMMEVGVVPRKLYLRKEKLSAILSPLASKLAVEIVRVRELSMDRHDHSIQDESSPVHH